MKILVTGTRGIPNIPGGVETHCAQLYPRMLKGGENQIEVTCRKRYLRDYNLRQWNGVSLVHIFAPGSKYLEAFIHTFLSVVYAAFRRPDIVHIHAIGPNFMTPLARLLGLKVVMTHHGPDYKRHKWNRVAKLILKAGEWAGMRFANKVIAISEEIKQDLSFKYRRNDVVFLPNGISKQDVVEGEDHLSKFGLEKGKYIFTLGRFVPEKGFDYLISAYAKSDLSKQYKFVIAGDADHETVYSLRLKKQAQECNVILTGFIKGSALDQIFSNAALFVLPSFYEGLSFSILEAMSHGLPILASDIPANLQFNLSENNYYEAGNEKMLTDKFNSLSYKGNERVKYNMQFYDWDKIAELTLKVYKEILG